MRGRRAGGCPASAAAGCRPTPRRHSALIPSQVPPGTLGWGCGCVPPRQSHPRRLLPAGTRPHHRHRCCWTLSPRAAGTSQAGSRVKLGKEASPVAQGDCPGCSRVQETSRAPVKQPPACRRAEVATEKEERRGHGVFHHTGFILLGEVNAPCPGGGRPAKVSWEGNLCGDAPDPCADPLKHPYGWKSLREKDLGSPGRWRCWELRGAPANRLRHGNPCSPGTSAPEQRWSPADVGFLPSVVLCRSQGSAAAGTLPAARIRAPTRAVKAERGFVSFKQGARG